MKKLSLIFFILIGLYLVACKKTDGPGEIYGKWKLTETLADPGDGSGKYEKVKGKQYVTFKRSGVVEGNALPEITSFKILDSIRMELTSRASSQPFVYRYKLSANALTINPPCFEGCGMKFIRD